MQICSGCSQRLWSTDKGVCPTCRPEENRAVYGLKPLSEIFQVPELIKPVPKVLIVKESKRRFFDKTFEDTTDDGTDYSLESSIKAHIIKVYKETGKNKTKTSKRLGITIKTLYNHLNRYGVL